MSQIFMLGRNGLQELQPMPVLPVGCKIIAFGYAGAVQNFAVIDTDMNVVEIPYQYHEKDEDIFLDEYFSPRHKLDKYTCPISEKFGIGFYYDLDAPKYSDEEMKKACDYADRVERLKQEREDAKKKASTELSAKLAKEYAYLTKHPKTAREITNNMRNELKRKFPAVKFSVRYSSFSGGDSVDVVYTDGVLESEVAKVVNKYQDSHSDFSGDYWDYDPSEFNKLFGGVKYVMTKRNMSDEVRVNLVAEVVKICPFLADNAEIHSEVFWDKLRESEASQEDKNRIFEAVNGCHWMSAQSIARCIHAKTDYTKTQQTKEDAPAVAEGSGVQIVDYSEKAIAVVGDTKEIKDILKSLGGRFNSHLSCGAGWIFSKLKREDVRHALGL